MFKLFFAFFIKLFIFVFYYLTIVKNSSSMIKFSRFVCVLLCVLYQCIIPNLTSWLGFTDGLMVFEHKVYINAE